MRVKSFIFRVAGGLVVLVLLTVAALGLAVHRTHPPITGERELEGLAAAVEISRDERGVARIRAESTDDLFFAQGYLHASERLWQMEFQRRVVAGRLSELFGPDLIEADTFLRRVNLARVAERAVETASPPARRAIERYAAGVNAFIELGPPPLELMILRVRPEPWSAREVGAVAALMAFDLGQNWEFEAVRRAMIEKVGATMVGEILPPYEYRGPPVWSAEQLAAGGFAASAHRDDSPHPAIRRSVAGVGGSGSQQLAAGVRALRDLRRLGPLPRLGSNSWVVAGMRTAHGTPHLANDVHLGLALPSVWYELELEVPGELWVRGFSIPGGPLVAVGHNERLAWGLTNTGDTQDLYLERRHPDRLDLFEFDGEWYEAEIREESIAVSRRTGPQRIKVVETRNGPLVTEDLDLALGWTAYEADTSIYDALLGMISARNWPEFRAALRDWSFPAQNVVYADTEGTIAFRTAGLIPMRHEGAGLLPVPGWETNELRGRTIPFEELPELVNPPRGYIATANHRVTEAPYPYSITGDPQPPARMRRITAQLEEDAAMTVERSMEMQTDWYNQHAADRLPRFLEALAGHELPETAQAARDALADWLEYPLNAPGEAGPLIFSAWHYNAMRSIFEPHLGEELYRDFLEARDLAYNSFEAVLDGVVTAWTPAGVDTVLRDSFRETVDELAAAHGSDPPAWRWGDVMTLELTHPLGASALLRPFFNRGPYSYGGGQMTVGRASYRLQEPFRVVTGAGIRMVTRLGPQIEAWVAHAGGQSGHPGHRSYADQLTQWREGGYRPVRHFAGDEPPRRWRKQLSPP